MGRVSSRDSTSVKPAFRIQPGSWSAALGSFRGCIDSRYKLDHRERALPVPNSLSAAQLQLQMEPLLASFQRAVV